MSEPVEGQSVGATLYIIQGFLAAGKSTFSRQLAAETGAMRLNADEWCEANYPAEKLETDWDNCFANAVEHLWETAAKELAAGHSVIFDMGFWTVASRDHARERAQEWGVPLLHYYVTAPDDVLKARLIARDHPMAQAHHDNFDTVRGFFHDPQPHEIIIRIETHTGAVKETISKTPRRNAGTTPCIVGMMLLLLGLLMAPIAAHAKTYPFTLAEPDEKAQAAIEQLYDAGQMKSASEIPDTLVAIWLKASDDEAPYLFVSPHSVCEIASCWIVGFRPGDDGWVKVYDQPVTEDIDIGVAPHETDGHHDIVQVEEKADTRIETTSHWIGDGYGNPSRRELQITQDQ